MKHPFLPLVALLLPILLPSCVKWNIGQRIREAGEIHTGMDVFHPVDGKIYRTPESSRYDDAYVRAPEVTYRSRTPLVESEQYGFLWNAMWENEACDLRPTGREHWVLVDCHETTPRGYKRTATPPDNAKAFTATEYNNPHRKDDRRASSYGSFSHTEASISRRLAAAPFDYLIDPALSGVSTVALGTATACAAVVSAPFFLIWPEWFIKK